MLFQTSIFFLSKNFWKPILCRKNMKNPAFFEEWFTWFFEIDRRPTPFSDLLKIEVFLRFFEGPEIRENPRINRLFIDFSKIEIFEIWKFYKFEKIKIYPRFFSKCWFFFTLVFANFIQSQNGQKALIFNIFFPIYRKKSQSRPKEFHLDSPVKSTFFEISIWKVQGAPWTFHIGFYFLIQFFDDFSIDFLIRNWSIFRANKWVKLS